MREPVRKVDEGLVVHAFNHQHLRGRGRQIPEVQASLVYRISSRTTRATQKTGSRKNQKLPSPSKKREVGEGNWTGLDQITGIKTPPNTPPKVA